MKRVFLSLTIFLFTTQFSYSQEFTGAWKGKLTVQGIDLRLVFHVAEENGVYSTTLDSPDQGAYGIETDTTIVNGNEIVIKAAALGLTLEGNLNPETKQLDANFKQGPLKLKISFDKDENPEPPKPKPQEPVSFEYQVEEVKFENKNGDLLAGTLTIPKSGVFEKVGILVTGSGPQNRDEELLGHKPFLVLSDYLTKNGIAVLRYDDRGIAESEGDFASATSLDLADDAESAYDFLRSRSDMDGKKFGIIGHSEGGMIAPVVAARSEMDFIVLLSGPGTELDVLLGDQTKAIMEANGADMEEMQGDLETSAGLFKFIKEHPDMELEELREGVRAILKAEYGNLTEEELEEVGGDPEAMMEQQVSQVTSAWFRAFLNFSPKDYLTKVVCPVLAINGSKDLQVLAKPNLQAIGKYLAMAGNTNYLIRELPDLNHLFQVSETGSPNEYAGIEETFNEGAMKIIADWVKTYDKL